jgi:hypothetical protein
MYKLIARETKIKAATIFIEHELVRSKLKNLLLLARDLFHMV